MARWRSRSSPLIVVYTTHILKRHNPQSCTFSLVISHARLLVAAPAHTTCKLIGASDSKRKSKIALPPHCRNMGGGGAPTSNSSSSGEEDGDAEWRAAINSVTSSATVVNHATNGDATHEHDDESHHKPKKLKHHQIKAQKLLEDILGQTIEVVTVKAKTVEKDPAAEDAGVRLFRKAPSGIVFDQREELQGPKKKPKIVPGEELHETSKKLKKQLQSIVVDGADIIAAARTQGQKSLAKLEAREIAAKAAAKREEERVAELKRIRGERWLPRIAREMRVNAQCRR